MPEEEAHNSSIIKVYFTLIKVKKILRTYKMYMKTLIYLISRIRYLILAVKGQNSQLIKHHYVFCNVTNKQFAPLFSKNSFIDFSIEERLLREIAM